MLVLEGPDNSGKTTLARKLCEKYDLEYLRPPSLSSTDGAPASVADWWDDVLENPKMGVYDRTFYISDFIYRSYHPQDSPVRSSDRMTEALQTLMEYSYVVFCLPTWTWSSVLCHRERYRGGGLKYTDLAGDRVIHWTYEQYASLLRMAYPSRVLFYRPDARLPVQDYWLSIIDQAITQLKEGYIDDSPTAA